MVEYLCKIKLLALFKKESKHFNNSLLIFMLISSFSNALMLEVINNAAISSQTGNIAIKYFVLFALTIVLFIISQKIILDKSVYIIEETTNNIRKRLADKLRKSELIFIENYGN